MQSEQSFGSDLFFFPSFSSVLPVGLQTEQMSEFLGENGFNYPKKPFFILLQINTHKKKLLLSKSQKEWCINRGKGGNGKCVADQFERKAKFFSEQCMAVWCLGCF
jgi:hypothetical protein